jgi:hypothetical protein
MMSFAGLGSRVASPPPPPVTQVAGGPPNASSGANQATIGQAHYDRSTLGEPADATPAPKFGQPTGQKQTLGP